MGYSEFLENTLLEASKIALRYFGNVTPTTKIDDNNQVLTEADIAIGKFIVDEISKTYPDHNIIDEEAGVIDNGSNMTWVVDPIEATSNFASGSEDYGIMIGLLDGDTPIAGGIIVPPKGVVYLAEKGKGATKNGKPIHVDNETPLLKKLVSYGVDAHHENPEATQAEMRMLGDLILVIRNMRNSGCEAIDNMYVAEGIYGGRINMTSKIWDNVGPQCVVEEAGGVWTDAFGEPIDYSNPLTRVDQNYTFCTGSPLHHSGLTAVTAKYKTSLQGFAS